MTEKYSAAWVQEQVKAADAEFLLNHECSICGVGVGYVFVRVSGNVYYQSSCDCGFSSPQPSSYDAIAKWLELQSSDEIRDRLMAKLR